MTVCVIMGSMAAPKAQGVRERVRAELVAEIKAAARRQLATNGAPGISLRAISREMGMASSAIYRYFASREDLLTAMIIDTYDAIGEVVEAANGSCATEDFPGRWIAMTTALRSWALNNPHDYALVYGSPVPGYVAPDDTINPATRVPVALMTVLVEGAGVEGHTQDSERLSKMLMSLWDFTERAVSPDALASAVSAWAEVFGLISLELFGHFVNTIDDPEAFFTHAVTVRGEQLFG